MKTLFLIFASIISFVLPSVVLSQSIIANHLCTDITQIPLQCINSARSNLHIAYGHTSHGSQLTDGMSGLVGFSNSGGKGLSLPNNIFAWNHGGTGGALDLHDYAMGGDVGYYPAWEQNTRSYLGTVDANGRGSNNPDVNVIIWSWCGQVSGYSEQSMIEYYLAPMNQLEIDYPNIKFVYMTGHLDGSGLTGNLHVRNEQIRKYCRDNNKILFDFADIECYDPEGAYYGDKHPADGCTYDANGDSVTSETGDPDLPIDGSGDKNWAVDWQNSHTLNVDWYSCGSAHTQSLNANQKAYAAWWLWARLAGWSGTADVDGSKKDVPHMFNISQNYPNPFNPTTTIEFTLIKDSKVLLKVYNALGQVVATLLDRERKAGILHRVPFDASRFSSGVYFYRLEAEGNVQVKKLVLAK